MGHGELEKGKQGWEYDRKAEKTEAGRNTGKERNDKKGGMRNSGIIEPYI